ncbi:MAG: hypothetical protein IJQ62_09975 [Clostridia bacterium]|nr:hypothetical protein [Clostridia bacterium]
MKKLVSIFLILSLALLLLHRTGNLPGRAESLCAGTAARIHGSGILHLPGNYAAE